MCERTGTGLDFYADASRPVSIRILIIDDDVPSLALADYLLQSAGHATTTANDGEQAVRLALSQPFDLIISDLHLPGLTGYEIVARLRASPQWRPVPLVAVTASSMVGDRESVLAAGFDGYISKPIEPEKFVAAVEGFLGSSPPGRAR
jgi:CheY-like chemotaxis protein